MRKYFFTLIILFLLFNGLSRGNNLRSRHSDSEIFTEGTNFYKSINPDKQSKYINIIMNIYLREFKTKEFSCGFILKYKARYTKVGFCNKGDFISQYHIHRNNGVHEVVLCNESNNILFLVVRNKLIQGKVIK